MAFAPSVMQSRFVLAFSASLVVYDPALVEEILLSRTADFEKQTRGYKKLRLVFGNGLLTSEGELWRRQRRIAQPAFHRRRIESFGHAMGSNTAAMLLRWEAEDDGSVLDIAAEMNELALRIAGETLFSTDVSTIVPVVRRALSALLDHFMFLVSSPLPYPELWPFRENRTTFAALKDLEAAVYDIIRARKQAGVEGEDLLGMLMSATDEETGERMSEKQLRDEVLTMLLAAHETTANTLSWTLHLLDDNPRVLQRAQDEIAAVVRDAFPTVEQAMQLEYLDRVVRESLRLYPPAWTLARSARVDTRLGGYRVKRGTYVLMPTYTLHRDERLWPHATAFDPDRWLPEAADRRAAARFAYFPFSGGQRQCIGDRFAMLEAKVALGAILKRFVLNKPPGSVPTADPSVTLRVKGGMPMRITRRETR